MRISFSRVLDAGTCVGGHGISDNIAFAAPFSCVAIKLEFEDDNMGVGLLLSRDEASDLSHALVECLCDG